MTAGEAIASLDAAITEHGQRVVLRRGTGTPVATAGFVRGYKPEALAGLITQADRQVTMSPTGLAAYGAPKAQDQVSLDGVLGTVLAVEEIRIGATPVRYNVTVRLT